MANNRTWLPIFFFTTTKYFCSVIKVLVTSLESMTLNVRGVKRLVGLLVGPPLPHAWLLPPPRGCESRLVAITVFGGWCHAPCKIKKISSSSCKPSAGKRRHATYIRLAVNSFRGYGENGGGGVLRGEVVGVLGRGRRLGLPRRLRCVQPEYTCYSPTTLHLHRL